MNVAPGMLTNEQLAAIDPNDLGLIVQIVHRAAELTQQVTGLAMTREHQQQLSIDLALCHHLHLPLSLLQILMASPDDFAHDVFGINVHWDRRDFTLREDFKPRLVKAKLS